MAERTKHGIVSRLDLLRDVSATFDDNVLHITASTFGESDDIPVELLQSKGRFLDNIPCASNVVGTFEPYGWLDQENAQLRMENYSLRLKIHAIEERLTSLETIIPKEKVVILREVSKEEAEKEILELFSQGQTLYYSDIAEQLRLDLKSVVEICNALQSKGEIEVVDDTLQRR